MYEVAWARMLSLSFGSTTLAVSAVTSGFLGGLGLGAWLYARALPRLGRPLRVVAGIELGIAIGALLLTALLQRLPVVLAQVQVEPGPALDLLRVGVAFGLLLVPSALMGATFPALCTVLVRSLRGMDRHLGALYGLHTVGGAAGALLGGVVLIEALGLRGAVGVGAALNVAVAVAALSLARVPGAFVPPSDEVVPSALPLGLTAVVLVGAGCTTLGYEIVAFRALRYLVGNSTYAVTATFVVFLLGLGLGALLFRSVRRSIGAERGLVASLLGAGLLVVVALAVEDAILSDPALNARLSVFSAGFGDLPWGLRVGRLFAVSIALLLPATVCMGLAFPLASALFLGSVRGVGARVGAALLLSNVGSIAGAAGTALVLLPALGTVGSARVLAVVGVALGLAVAWSCPLPRIQRAGAIGVAAAVLAGGVLLPDRLPFGGALLLDIEGELVFEEEGELATVQVRVDPDRPERRGMLVDGTLIGVSGGWFAPLEQKQLLLAHLPLALDPGLARTLNVGLGSASTLAALAAYPSVERLDVVEINSAVVRGAAAFTEGRVLADPRVRLVTDDVVHFLLRSRQTWDLIVSDGKQNADFSGNAKVLSQEFYRLAAARLSERGMMVQWIPLGTPHEELRIILRTFGSAFAEVEVFYAYPSAVLLVGGARPLTRRPGPSAQWLPARVHADYARLALQGSAGVRALHVAGGPSLRAVVGPGPVNEWNRMPLEWSSFRYTATDRVRSAQVNLELLQSAAAER